MEKGSKRIIQLLLLVSIVFSAAMLLPKHTVFAADTAVRVAAVEYYEEQIVVLNNGNDKIYYATQEDASRGKWEVVNADDGLFTVIDISWLSPNDENVLIIKGNKDSTKSRVVIYEKPNKLAVSINYANMDSLSKDACIAPIVNVMSSAGTGSTPITFYDLEYRKGITGQWTSARYLTAGLLDKFLVKGTYLFFRIRAIDDCVNVAYGGTDIDFNKRREAGLPFGILYYKNESITVGTDYPDGTKGRRCSDEVKVKIAKMPESMVTGIDGEDFTAAIKYGKEYRVTITTGGSIISWVKVTDKSVSMIPLTTLVNISGIDGTEKDKAFPAMKIEIRNYATSKSAASKITEINLDAQRTIDNPIEKGRAPADAIAKGDKKVYMSYEGNKNLLLEIPSATSELPYEYCIVKNTGTFNLSKAAWTSVTKGTVVKIPSNKAVDLGTLYVRQKEIKSKKATATSDAVGYKLASTYVTADIKYPSIPKIEDQDIIFTKGYSKDITFTATLNVSGKVAFENDIESIKLGTKTIDFKTKLNDTSDVDTLDITLLETSLKNMANCYNRAIYIYYKNGTVDKTSIKLTIQNPAPAATMTVTFEKADTSGTTFNITTPKPAGNKWYYVIGTQPISGVTKMDTVPLITTQSGTETTTNIVKNITITEKQYITVFEVDASGYIVKFYNRQITADDIR